MRWFQQLCRNTGLMFHNIAKPIKDDAAATPSKKIIKHEVEEESVGENMTLRRTTIEEIEITPGTSTTNPPDPSQPGADPKTNH